MWQSGGTFTLFSFTRKAQRRRELTRNGTHSLKNSPSWRMEIEIGCRFWDLALREHAQKNKNAVYDEALSSFFRNVDTRGSTPLNIPVGDGRGGIATLKARSILVDMEEGVVNQLLHGPLRDLFDNQQRITDISGSGNNWAQGHSVYGPMYREGLLEKIRKEAEHCDALSSFFILHSIGGGTGSGLGSYICELLADEFPEVYRFSTAIFPSGDDDVVTSPYNSILAAEKLIRHVDCVLPVENQALIDICNRYNNLQAQSGGSSSLSSKGSGASLASSLSVSSSSSSRLNSSAGGLSGSSVFPGGPTVSLTLDRRFGSSKRSSVTKNNQNESVVVNHPVAKSNNKAHPFEMMNNIVANLLLNLTSSSRFEGSLNVDINEITTNLVPYPRLHFLVSSLTPLYHLADMKLPPRRLDQMFSDAFSKDYQLLKSDPRQNLYLACALIVRGDVEISDIRRNIERIKSNLNFIHWNKEGWKTGLCSVPPVGQPYSLLTLGNNTCMKNTFSWMRDRFVKLYRRKAHIYHYTDILGDTRPFDGALENINNLIAEYEEMESQNLNLSLSASSEPSANGFGEASNLVAS